MKRTTVSKQSRDEAIARLREWIKPGDTLHTITVHSAPSGMSRSVRVYKAEIEQQIVRMRCLAYNIAKACEITWDEKREAVVMRGCGYNTHFQIAYQLGQVLWPEGYDCVGNRCPSADHVNGDRDYTPHRHKSGGYALRTESL